MFYAKNPGHIIQRVIRLINRLKACFRVWHALIVLQVNWFQRGGTAKLVHLKKTPSQI